MPLNPHAVRQRRRVLDTDSGCGGSERSSPQGPGRRGGQAICGALTSRCHCAPLFAGRCHLVAEVILGKPGAQAPLRNERGCY